MSEVEPIRYIDRPRLLAAAGIGLGALAAWTALAAIHDALPGTGPGSASAWPAGLCRGVALPAAAALPAAMAIWALMSVAMMLPTAAPAIDIHVRLTRRIEARRMAHVAAFTGGYLAAWTGFALVVAIVQVLLGPRVGGLAGTLPQGALAGGLLLLAGGYQVTPLKQACLAKCRNPLAFFLSHWREGTRGAFGMGMHHGLICIGCCWALMGLMFVTGTMNLAWMAGLGLVMLLEKTAPGAAQAGRLIGLAMTLAGAALIASEII